MKISTILISIVFVLVFNNSVKAQINKKETGLPPDSLYSVAMKYYNKKVYYKAIPIFEKLMGLYKGNRSTEELYYYYCMSHYEEKNLIMAAYHFKNYFEQFPGGIHAEDALYKYAWCFYYNSPEYTLDQEDSKKALEALQYFINTFPNSSRVDDANEIIDKIHNKLKSKVFEAADLYYKTQSYKAAAYEYGNVLNQYPDIENAEEVMFLIVKSKYKYASLSINSKKAERYIDMIDQLAVFEKGYPQTIYSSQLNKMKEDALYQIILSSFNHALSSDVSTKEYFFHEMLKKYNTFAPQLKNELHKTSCDKMKEQAAFYTMRANYQLGQTNNAQQSTYLNKVVKLYYEFTDVYKDSKYSKEAEKLYKRATENLKKI